MDKLSIIIPSYNQSKYLPDAIESALCQTRPCKVTVIDDGSTDDSLEIARKYPVRVISQVNKGLASARNTGIMNCDTEYVLPLDADDILMDTAVEKITQRIMETNADIVAPSIKCFGENNQTVILDHEDNITLKSFIEVGNRLAYCCAFRRSKAVEIGGYSPRMTWGWEDLHFWINMMSTGCKLSVIQDPLMLYRVKKESMITTANQHAQELYAQIRKDFPKLYE